MQWIAFIEKEGMKKLGFLIIVFSFLFGCKKDEAPSCTRCNSDLSGEFELCRESNGNASVNGQDTGTSYEVYISDLEETGVQCGI